MNSVFHKESRPENVVREVRERAEHAYKSAQENIAHAGNRFTEVSKTVGKKGQKWLGSLGKLVKQYPLTSVAIGIASGYVLVRLAKR